MLLPMLDCYPRPRWIGYCRRPAAGRCWRGPAMLVVRRVLAPVLVLLATPLVHAEAPPDERTVAERVDRLLAAEWTAAGVQPGEPSTDAEFLRRVYLDLTGKI